MKILILLIILFFSSEVFPQTTADRYNNAMEAYRSGQYSTAVRLFDDFFKGADLNDELYATAKYYYSDALLNLGEKTAAASGFEFIVNNFKWTAFRDKSLFKLGVIHFEDKQFDDCRKDLNQLLEEYPGNENTGSALYLIGESYTEQNRLQDAAEFLEKAVNDRSDNSYLDYTIYSLANTYEKMGDYNKAVNYYDQLLSYYQNSSLALSAQLRIGVCYFKLKEYQAAILELNNPVLTNLPPDIYSESLYLLANTYYRVEEYKSAEDKYSEVVKSFPSSDVYRDSWYGTAWCYFQEKKYDDAFKIFDSLSDGDDSIAVNSSYWKAESKRYAGKEDDAFRLFNRFLKKYPGDKLARDARYHIGEYYYNNKDYVAAESYLKAAGNSDDPAVSGRAYIMLGEVNLNKKDYDKAAGFFNQAINKSVQDTDLVNRAKLGLGTAEYYQKNYDGAVGDLNGLIIPESETDNDKINFYLAESYYALGKYQDALNSYNKISPGDTLIPAQSLYGTAYCYFNLKNYEKAEELFSGFIKKYSRNKRINDAKFRLADSYYATKDYTAASRIYRDLFAGSSPSLDDPYGYYLFAQALYKAGNTDEAINEFENLQLKYPDSQYAEGSMYTIGWIYFKEENFKEAISQYRDMISLHPDSPLIPLVYYSIGDSYFNQARYDSAIANYEKVIALYPSSDYVYDALSGIQYSYVAKNEPQKAISLIDNFVSKNPGLSFSDELFFQKGEIYYSMHQYDKAGLSYKEFITDYPQSEKAPDAYYWMGKSAQNLGQNDEALSDFKQVFDSYPQSEAAGAAVLEIGNIYNGMKDYDSAINIYDQALNKIPKSSRIAEIHFMKGVTYSNKQDPEDAYRVFQEVVQSYSGNIFADKAKFELGLIELAAGSYDDARIYFKDLSDSRTDDIGAQAQYYMGVSFADQDSTDLAIDALERVRSNFSTYDEWLTKAYMKLAEIYVAKGSVDMAKELYRAIIAKHKGDAYGKEARNKLGELEK